MTETAPSPEHFHSCINVFQKVIHDVADDAWAAPSPCDGWSAADVVGHVVDTQRSFLTSRDVALPELPNATPNPQDLFAAHHNQLTTALTDTLWATPYDSYFGPSTIGDTLTDVYGFDLLLHAWDIGQAVGQPIELTDDHVTWLSARCDAFGDAMYSEGICQGPLPVPEDATASEKLLARVGRQAVTAGSALG